MLEMNDVLNVDVHNLCRKNTAQWNDEEGVGRKGKVKEEWRNGRKVWKENGRKEERKWRNS